MQAGGPEQLAPPARKTQGTRLAGRVATSGSSASWLASHFSTVLLPLRPSNFVRSPVTRQLSAISAVNGKDFSLLGWLTLILSCPDFGTNVLQKITSLGKLPLIATPNPFTLRLTGYFLTKYPTKTPKRDYDC